MPTAPPTHKPKLTNMVTHRAVVAFEWYDRALKTARWQKFRRWFLGNHPLCYECGMPGMAHDLEVHHLIPRHERPDLMYDAGNCQALCKSCHSRVTRKEQQHG